MRNLIKMAGLPILLVLLLYACKKEVKTTEAPIPDEVIAKIKSMGLSTEKVKKVARGYVAEGDIVITEENLKKDMKFTSLRYGNAEQYWTGVSVCPLPRTITIGVDPSLGSRYTDMVDVAINRYNSLGLQINFIRVAGTGDIQVYPYYGCDFLAMAGFSGNCNPYPYIDVAVCYLDWWDFNTCVSIMAHEIGHCIGFRHTDYQDRSFSCGGGFWPEGGTAYHIPGTPSGPYSDGSSWMLSCFGNGVDRPFNGNDVNALYYLY